MPHIRIDNQPVTQITASVGEIQRGQLEYVADAMLSVPAIVLLLLAAALLTGFYLWLTDMEKRYSRN